MGMYEPKKMYGIHLTYTRSNIENNIYSIGGRVYICRGWPGAI
jgi:hypothetical protein